MLPTANMERKYTRNCSQNCAAPGAVVLVPGGQPDFTDRLESVLQNFGIQHLPNK